MFNWAAETFEKLSQTVAPPPADAASRFVYLVGRGEEASAQGCLAEFEHPFHTIVQPNTKGTYPIHLACQHGLVNLIQQLMSMPGADIQLTDAQGNTPLHYACLTSNKENGLPVVQMLVKQYKASVVAKNGMQQTPYDVASLNNIRQYLLPLQLQQETQEALDNGGVGLPPGIDMGGLKVSYSNVPPPPMGAGGGGGYGPPPTTPHAPPAMGMPPTATPYNHGMPGTSMYATPSPNPPPPSPGFVSPPPPAGGFNAPPPAAQAPPVGPQEVAAQTATTESQQPEPAPTSTGSSTKHTYSRSGASSAAVGGGKYRPDGFHSSSSDINLQRKYGHSAPNSANFVPPPPLSGNGPPASNGSSASATGATPTQEGSTNSVPSVNPYSLGGVGGVTAARRGIPTTARSRYPVYNANTGQTSAMAPPSTAPPGVGAYNPMAMMMPPPPAATNAFNMFQPGGATTVTSAPVPSMPAPQAMQMPVQSAPAAAPSHCTQPAPTPWQGSQSNPTPPMPATTATQQQPFSPSQPTQPPPASPFPMPPPPFSSQMPPAPAPAAASLALSQPFAPPPPRALAPNSPFAGTPKNGGATAPAATDVFAAPSPEKQDSSTSTTPVKVTSPIASPTTPSPPVNASAFFGSPPPSETAQAGVSPPITNTAPVGSPAPAPEVSQDGDVPTPKETTATAVASSLNDVAPSHTEESDEGMIDVPLSDEQQQQQPASPAVPQQSATRTTAASLFASGPGSFLPPPPFSSTAT